MPHSDILREAAPIVLAGLVLLVGTATLLFLWRYMGGMHRAALEHMEKSTAAAERTQAAVERELSNGLDPSSADYVGFRAEVAAEFSTINGKLANDWNRMDGHEGRIRTLKHDR